ncbi:hypothetical protein GCM10027051_29130 [Niabella terrae]
MSFSTKQIPHQFNGINILTINFIVDRQKSTIPILISEIAEDDILFVNFSNDNSATKFIRRHYEKIKSLYQEKAGKNFIFLEEEKNQLDFIDILGFNYPSLNKEQIDLWKSSAELLYNTDFFTKSFVSGIRIQENESGTPAKLAKQGLFKKFFKSRQVQIANEPRIDHDQFREKLFASCKFGFLRARRPNRFAYTDFSSLEEQDYMSFFEYHSNLIRPEIVPTSVHEEIYYQLNSSLEPEKEENDNLADINFLKESEIIAEEIRERILRLKKNGFNELLIKMIGQSLDNEDIKKLFQPAINQYSSIYISKDYKILLPEFENMEIKLTPLPKTVFFFFLRHPEGVLFKRLPEYRKEITAIYSQLTNLQDSAKFRKSIQTLTDPRCNSINEKCSRIKEAFLSRMEEGLAQQYYIHQGRGLVKYIPAAREESRIIWEKVLPKEL